MNIAEQIAKHFKEVHFGGNWTGSNMKDVLSGITFEQATKKVKDLNTILTLTYHIHYYVAEVLRVFEGEPLKAKDEFSFDHPEITSQAEWDAFVTKVFKAAEDFEEHLKKLPEDCFDQPFTDEKYGNYYRNMHGIIEHTHYHLGQISLLKKLV
ncbi:MAG: DinB family protein [Bacteroidota bacterium]